MKEQWVIGNSIANSKSGFPPTPDEIAYVAGGAKQQAHARVVVCNEEMQRFYADNLVAIGNQIFPFLYSEATADGGRYTLLIDESQSITKKPVPPIYEVAKSISHIPLGVWSIISRYAESAKGGDWIEPLSQYGVTLAKARKNLHELGLDNDVEKDAVAVLEGMKNFIDAKVGDRNYSIADYTKSVFGISSQLLRLQEIAAKTQVEAFTTVLASWRKLIGDETWERLYVVISAQWTLSTENVHQLIIANAMSTSELAASNIFVTSRPLSGLDEARALCGRIVGDRVMARQTVSAKTKRGKENAFSLSSSRDLISKAAEDAIAKLNGD